MRVLDFTQWYAPASGGIRTYLEQKARYASRHALDHAVVVTGRRERSGLLHGSPLLQVPAVPFDPRSGYHLAVRPGHVLAILEATRPDVVVLHDATAFPATVRRWASRTGARMVAIVHSELEAGAVGLPRPVRRPVRAVLARVQDRGLSVPDLVITTTPALQGRVIPRTPAETVVVGLGVDASVFHAARPDPALRRRLAPDGSPLLLHAGRLSVEKHVMALPEVLACLPGTAVMAIAGDGPAASALRRRAMRLGVAGRLRMLGHIADRAVLARLMATADCLVHPNPDEPYGLAPLEALAAGTRVVAPRGGGLADVIGGRGASLVEGSSPQALAQGVLRALDGERPRPDLADLTWERTFDAEWAHYRALTAAPGARARAATVAVVPAHGRGRGDYAA